MSNLTLFVLIVLALCACFCLYVLLEEFFIYLIGNSGFIKDKDPFDNKCDGLNSTNWNHDYICEKCMSFTCHDEQMTGICLSCGENFDWVKGGVSTRLIIRNKRWVRQIKWRGTTYINKKKLLEQQK